MMRTCGVGSLRGARAVRQALGHGGLDVAAHGGGGGGHHRLVVGDEGTHGRSHLGPAAPPRVSSKADTLQRGALT